MALAFLGIEEFQREMAIAAAFLMVHRGDACISGRFFQPLMEN